MSAQPKKKYGNVNLGFMDPVETLHPDSLKLFSKEELSAYLQYYDIPFASSDTKPELKRQLRMLIYAIKDGSTQRRDGIGSDLKKHIGVRPSQLSSQPSAESIASRSNNAPTSVPLANSSSSTQRMATGSTQTSNTSNSSSSATSSTSSRSTIQATDHGDRPAILDEGLEFAVADLAAPTAVFRLESQFPHIQPRMLRYYKSLVDKHEHLSPALKPAVARSPLEPMQSGTALYRRCQVCGGRALNTCSFSRCRICCQLQPQECLIHQKLSAEFANVPRPLDRSGVPITHGTSSVPSSTTFVRKGAPTAPKAAHVLLGEVEAQLPWQELREEALYRSVQNSAAMESIFSAQSVDTISSGLEKWMAKAPANHTAALTAECDQMEAEHAQKMQEWYRMADAFENGFNSIADNPTEAKRREIFYNLDDILPVPLTPKKRMYIDT